MKHLEAHGREQQRLQQQQQQLLLEARVRFVRTACGDLIGTDAHVCLCVLML